MVQNFKKVYLLNDAVVPLFDTPNQTLTRIFFGIYFISQSDPSLQVDVSAGDPNFTQGSTFSLTYLRTHYEFSGPNMFQGNVFVRRAQFAVGWICATEILQ